MLTEKLARNITNTTYSQISQNAVQEAKRSLLNWLGVAIGASHHESMEKVMNIARLTGSQPQATIFGRSEKVDILFAALLNGMSSHIFDFDDTLLETVLHPSAPVYPAVLAYAEQQKKSGRDVIEAFVIGAEVEARLALSVYPSHYWRGWHITGSVGGIGAAAAISKMLDLSIENTQYAIGISATEPTGLREMFGTMTKPFHPGKAAMNGLLAGLMAGQGFTSSKTPLEAERGFIKVLSEEMKLELITDNWGDKWEIEKNSYKPFASGIVTHPAIDAMVAIQKENDIQAEDVDSIVLFGHPLVKELTGKTSIATGLEGKFSVYHCVAAAFFHLKAGVGEFTDEFVNETNVQNLRKKIDLIIDDQLKEDQAKVIVKLTNGREITKLIQHAIGSMDQPMSEEQLVEKFMDVTGSVISTSVKEQLVDLVQRFEELDDLTPFFELCRPKERVQHF